MKQKIKITYVLILALILLSIAPLAKLGSGFSEQEAFFLTQDKKTSHTTLPIQALNIKNSTPFIFMGILSLYLFYMILANSGFDGQTSIISSLLLAISPAFIFLYSTINIAAFYITLTLASLFFFIQKKRIFLLVFWPIALFIAYFNIFASLILILTCFIYSAETGRKKYSAYTLSIILFLISLVTLIKEKYIHYNPDFSAASIFLNYIVELGSEKGISFFILILVPIGLYYLRSKGKMPLIYTSLIITIPISFYFHQLIPYFAFIFCAIAGAGISFFLKRRWSLKQIKRYTIFIITLGLILSTLSYITTLASKEEIDTKAIEFLKDKKGAVLSHHSNYYLIEAEAEKTAVPGLKISEKRSLKDSQTIFDSRNLKKTQNLLDIYNITYIYITEEMKDGKVWTEPEQGLLFLFRNSEIFKKAYSSENSEVWEYRG